AGRPPPRGARGAGPRGGGAGVNHPPRPRGRLAPERLADAFQLTLMSAGRLGAPDPLTTEEVVDLFLHGALAAPGEAR
ncbi:TetR family transcriptional regulator, partial [Streptomyces sp. NPDC059455]